MWNAQVKKDDCRRSLFDDSQVPWEGQGNTTLVSMAIHADSARQPLLDDLSGGLITQGAHEFRCERGADRQIGFASGSIGLHTFDAGLGKRQHAIAEERHRVVNTEDEIRLQ